MFECGIRHSTGTIVGDHAIIQHLPAVCTIKDVAIPGVTTHTKCVIESSFRLDGRKNLILLAPHLLNAGHVGRIVGNRLSDAINSFLCAERSVKHVERHHANPYAIGQHICGRIRIGRRRGGRFSRRCSGWCSGRGGRRRFSYRADYPVAINVELK